MTTLGDIIERNERLLPQRPAFVFGELRQTHGDFARCARRLASALHRRGLQRQDRIAVLSMNGPAFTACYAAAEWAGYVIGTVNFRLAPAEIAYVLRDTAPAIIVFESQYADTIAALRSELDGVRHYVCIGDAPAWAESFDALLDDGDDDGPPFRAQHDDLLYLCYTSGTTGKPKGVVHGHDSCLRIAEVLCSELGFDAQTRLLAVAPMFHMGVRTLALAAQFRGGCTVLHRGFDAVAVNQAFEQERITAIHLVPTMVQAVLDAPNFGQHDVSSLRTLLYGAAPMPVPLLRRAVEAFGPITWNGYGQTEINGLTFLAPHQHVLSGDERQSARLASVGQPHWQCELRIVGDDGQTLPAGMIGEVWARSATAMNGYWNNSRATCETLRDGWVRTGDMGWLDDENYLFLADRRKDMIISGGENIYSREVEEALVSHADVADAAVIGVPDTRWGEAVKAIVVPRPGHACAATDLIEHCREQIAAYKCPKAIEFVDELPRLGTGKVNKVELRARFAPVA